MINQIEDRKYLPSDEDLMKQINKCNTHCRAVAEGKFFMCFLSYVMEKLQAVPKDDRNSVNIYEKDAKENIYQFMRRDMPMPPCCYWCSGSREDIILPVAQQLTKALPYKKFVYEEK